MIEADGFYRFPLHSSMKRYFFGNWKMHWTPREAAAFVRTLLQHFATFPSSFFAEREIGIAPAFTHLSSILEVLQEGAPPLPPLHLTAQNMHWELQGAFTGEISGAWLKELGCTHVILGHSERRWIHHETSEEIHGKFLRALDIGLIPIVCIGEKEEEREKGWTYKILEEQLTASLISPKSQPGSPPFQIAGPPPFLIAYEPVWAIGTGKNATPCEAQEAHAMIRKWLAAQGGKALASCIPLLYGGSVKPENAGDLLQSQDINGFLIGGASLKLDSFLQIIQSG